MKGAFFALAEAKYAGGDGVKHTVFDNVDRATLKASPRMRAPEGVGSGGVGRGGGEAVGEGRNGPWAGAHLPPC